MRQRTLPMRTDLPQAADPELEGYVRILIAVVHRARLDASPQRRSLRPPDPQAERVQREAQFLAWIRGQNLV